MRILIISDAWKPQTNGVVRTYEYLNPELEKAGHTVHVIGPRDFPWRMPMPGYREIELALFPYRRLKTLIEAFTPDTIHIATEGPLGRAARLYCLRRGLPFTTCYHTEFPDYAAKRAAKILPLLYNPVRRFLIGDLRAFHNKSSALMVATPSLEATLKQRGFTVPMYRLTRGADMALYTPDKKDVFAALKHPVAIYVGRVAIEKNLEAYLSMPWDGAKAVTGDGPDLGALKSTFPDAVFTGRKTGADLAAHYQSADVFVFPSKTDTFGMVVVEAMSCGLPVAAYPVTGPMDIVTEPMLGALSENLSAAAKKALNAPGTRQDRHAYAQAHYSWPVAARQFIDAIEKSGAVIQKPQ
jgi:glycosyltransferase involved in cell wall biosynthesis